MEQKNKVIRPEAPQEFYEQYYNKENLHDAYYKNSHYYPLFKFVSQEVVKVEAKRVLEVGCGAGLFAHCLKDTAAVAYRGFDFSANAVAMAKQRLENDDIFFAGNALEDEPYDWDYDTIVCLEVLEHLEKDLEVVKQWHPGCQCVCSVPNFDYSTHVRFFRTESQVRSRYESLIEIDEIHRVPRALIRGRSLGAYLRQVRWSRNDYKRLLAHFGIGTFEHLAGWFVFTGRRRSGNV